MITVGAYAKINLYLDIEAKRTDGYHDILSVMQTVSLCDEIKIERTECGIEVKNEINIEKERDLAYRAAAAFFAAAGVRGGARIEVQKHIPMGAGLAGGSTDAAAVLRGLNEIYLNPLSEDKLLGIALTLGSDVPFCTVGGTKAIRGRGEKMANMPKMPDCAMVIAIGDDHVSTPEQFSELDREFNDFVEYKPQSDRIARGAFPNHWRVFHQQNRRLRLLFAPQDRNRYRSTDHQNRPPQRIYN